jgi:PAS domain S-box-containing protein
MEQPGCSIRPDALNELLVDQAPDALIFADSRGLIRFWNTRAQEIFGHSAADVLGRSVDIIIPERLREAHWRGYNSALTVGYTQYAGRTLTTRSVHKDGRNLYVELTFALVKDADAKLLGVLAIARDATERYLELKALRERLRQLETTSGGSASP